MKLEWSLVIERRPRQMNASSFCHIYITWAAALSQHYKFIDLKKVFIHSTFFTIFRFFFYYNAIAFRCAGAAIPLFVKVRSCRGGPCGGTVGARLAGLRMRTATDSFFSVNFLLVLGRGAQHF